MRAFTIGRTVVLTLILAGSPHLLGQNRSTPPNSVPSTAGPLRVEQLATLEFPWGMALLPDERLLITEKPGRLRIWADGKLSDPLQGVPEVVHRSPRDQGGLMDVELDPDFSNNQLLYLSYVEAAGEQPEALAETDDFRFGPMDLSDNILRGGVVARARLRDNQLSNVEVIWRQIPKTVGRGHFGNRVLFSPDGKLFITSADRMRFEPAQSLGSNLGKVIRLNPDGSTPDDNPFVGRENARGEIWSYGHRNILSAAFNESGQLWTVEMGPLGGDELNLIERGANYGWPLVSNGDHYGRSGVNSELTSIPGHGTNKEFKAPVRSWTPVISPSGATFYKGELFRNWRGSLLVGGLSSQSLIRLVLDGDRVPLEERIHLRRRIRDVLETPEGALLLLVDGREGSLIRLTPAEQ